MKYFEELAAAISNLEVSSVIKFAEYLRKCSENNGMVYVAGNGGSASISDHFVCDYNKGTLKEESNNPYKAICLNSSLALLSALNNDFEEKLGFSWQIEHFSTENDIFIAISSSGNSKNLINAIQSAKKKNVFTISLTGMDGGIISQLTNFNINVKSFKYGVIEDMHMAILHSIRQELI